MLLSSDLIKVLPDEYSRVAAKVGFASALFSAVQSTIQAKMDCIKQPIDSITIYVTESDGER